jgi:hypothetical protein
MTDRSKRNRGKINYTEPNESDEDIVIEQLPKPKTVKDAAVHQPPNNETAQDSAEDSDEFTLVKVFTPQYAYTCQRQASNMIPPVQEEA